MCNTVLSNTRKECLFIWYHRNKINRKATHWSKQWLTLAERLFLCNHFFFVGFGFEWQNTTAVIICGVFCHHSMLKSSFFFQCQSTALENSWVKVSVGYEHDRYLPNRIKLPNSQIRQFVHNYYWKLALIHTTIKILPGCLWLLLLFSIDKQQQQQQQLKSKWNTSNACLVFHNLSSLLSCIHLSFSVWRAFSRYKLRSHYIFVASDF